MNVISWCVWLVFRKDTKTIFLRNSTLLPVAWRVNGMDNLGDDFSLTTEHGVIDAKSEFALQMHFRAVRPTNIKKIVRLEVSDQDVLCITEVLLRFEQSSMNLLHKRSPTPSSC